MPGQATSGSRQSSIAAALLKEGIVSEKQLERALKVQSLLEAPRQLTDVIVDLGYAKRVAITDAIAKHGSTMRLGEILLEQGIISPDSLEMALNVQREQGLKLGEALIQIGALNERQLLQNIAHQARVPYIEPTFSMIETALLRGVSPDFLAKHDFVPFSKSEDGAITIVVSNLHSDTVKRAADELYQGKAVLALGPEECIKATIDDFRSYRQSDGKEISAQDQRDTAVNLVEHILAQAVEEGASDIHIEPMTHAVRVRYRIDGVLVYKTDLPSDLLSKVISRLKILAECDIAEHQRHQGGRILFHMGERSIDMRLSIYVSIHGQSAVLRVLNKDMALVTLDELGMTPSMLQRYRDDVLDPPTGVVLITGPTGSGKTTTLYSSIDYCNDIQTKIITAEDPAEFTIEGIVQCSINDKIGRSFALTLREIVRQDPDIIVLGEIRDKTTADVAIQAALTGHKVYSTFHTEDTIGGLLRLIDMDIETFLISSTVISVLAQRLLRRICLKCAAPYVPNARDVEQVGLTMAEVREYEYKKGRGCTNCSYTGYRGRVAVYELLVLNELVKEAILMKKTAHEIRQISMDTTGLVSMREDGIAKVVKGITTFEEILSHTPRTFHTRPLRQILTLSQ
jgi:type IV pilus assembly protein PilB